MDIVMGAHIAGGLVAFVAGALAVVARKGGTLHARAGSVFFVSMLVLGVTAFGLGLMKADAAGLGIGGLFTCYFVTTSWLAARRREGTAGWMERIACLVALGIGAIMLWGAFTGQAAPTPVGMGPVFALGGLCLLAGLLDLNAIVRRLTPVQRIARHLWRMCFAFFIATGSFFLGQQDVMPEQVRGSPVQLVLAFAPFAVMAFWLARVRFAKRFRALLQALQERPRASLA